MAYVDGFVIPIKKSKLAAYKKMAAAGGKLWMKYGALRYIECVGDDLKTAAKMNCVPFYTLAKTKADETVIFSFIVYKSKAHRNSVNAKVMKDPSMSPEKWNPMPFDMKRMSVGGFTTLVDL
ncbi:DUF1428 domain-containing protein [Candidatus Woesearchaeota archaeon]|nr:DUF1428 domain-containing protein [Candidatus Woesearchaeota archaeon]